MGRLSLFEREGTNDEEPRYCRRAFALATASHAAIETGLGIKPTDDAIVLFDGADLSQWTAGGNKPAEWTRADGILEVALDKGSIQTRRDFRDFRLHIEFNVPLTDATGQGRGNSGVYIQKRYEVQILDSYGLEPKHQDCGAIYLTKAPAQNVCKKPGEWQSYDILFTAAKWQGDKKISNVRITIHQNGVMIHNDFEIPNKTGAGSPEGPSAGPILCRTTVTPCGSATSGSCRSTKPLTRPTP